MVLLDTKPDKKAQLSQGRRATAMQFCCSTDLQGHLWSMISILSDRAYMAFHISNQ